MEYRELSTKLRMKKRNQITVNCTEGRRRFDRRTQARVCSAVVYHLKAVMKHAVCVAAFPVSFAAPAAKQSIEGGKGYGDYD